jgi:Ca-activated chloride channel homolog
MIAKPTQPAAPEITAEIDRPLINVEGGSVRHLVVTVRAPELEPVAAAERQPLNIGLVIDASGSMQGPPLEAAKQATLDLVAKLTATDHMSLVSFAEEAVRHVSATPLTPRGRAAVEKQVRGLATRGSTNLFDGWLDGCHAVAERQATCRSPERHHVVLLSDGHANQGIVCPEALARHAGELRARGIVTSTVGIGADYSPRQLQAIAEAGGGRMHDAELPHEIARIMMAELTDTLATTVENLHVCLRLPAGVKAETYGTAPCTPAADGCDVFVGSLIGGATRQVVVKLRLPEGAAGSTLEVGVAARWNAAGSDGEDRRELPAVELRFAAGRACLDQPRRRELVKAVAEQWIADIYHRATQLNQDGAERAAAELVERELAYLREYCAGVDEVTAEIDSLEQFAHTVTDRLSVGTSKEMLLMSYKTSRGETDRRGRGQSSYFRLLEEERRARRNRRGGSHQP